MTIHRRLNVPGFGGNFVWYTILQTLLDAGWKVQASGSGIGGVYSATGNVFDMTIGGRIGSNQTVGVGVGNETMGNGSCWFRVADPDQNRELLVTRDPTVGDSGDDEWWCGYSKAAKFTGGSPSANTFPSATDEVTVSQTGTKTSPGSIHNTGTTANLTHVVADDTASPSGEYGWLALEMTATNTSKSVMGLDDIRNTATGDTHPLVLFHMTNDLIETTFRSSTSELKTIFDDGGGSEVWDDAQYCVPFGAASYKNTGNQSVYDLLERPATLIVIGVPTGGYVGTSRWIYLAAVTRGYPNDGGVASSRDHWYIGESVLRNFGDGSTAPAAI